MAVDELVSLNAHGESVAGWGAITPDGSSWAGRSSSLPGMADGPLHRGLERQPTISGPGIATNVHRRWWSSRTDPPCSPDLPLSVERRRRELVMSPGTGGGSRCGLRAPRSGELACWKIDDTGPGRRPHPGVCFRWSAKASVDETAARASQPLRGTGACWSATTTWWCAWVPRSRGAQTPRPARRQQRQMTRRSPINSAPNIATERRRPIDRDEHRSACCRRACDTRAVCSGLTALGGRLARRSASLSRTRIIGAGRGSASKFLSRHFPDARTALRVSGIGHARTGHRGPRSAEGARNGTPRPL